MLINEKINSDNVTLISETGKSLGVISYDQAMLLACDKEMDLVVVNPNANPPIAKIIDYAKELYKQEKAKRKQKAKQHTIELKEIALSIKIDKHDLETKTKRAQEFLAKGNKVRVSVMLRGREMLFQDKAYSMIDIVKNNLNAQYEQPIKREGKRFSAIIYTKK